MNVSKGKVSNWNNTTSGRVKDCEIESARAGLVLTRKDDGKKLQIVLHNPVEVARMILGQLRLGDLDQLSEEKRLEFFELLGRLGSFEDEFGGAEADAQA